MNTKANLIKDIQEETNMMGGKISKNQRLMYFLYINDEIVFIGETSFYEGLNIHKHHANMVFNYYTISPNRYDWVLGDEDILDFLISWHNPIYNRFPPIRSNNPNEIFRLIKHMKYICDLPEQLIEKIIKDKKITIYGRHGGRYIKLSDFNEVLMREGSEKIKYKRNVINMLEERNKRQEEEDGKL